MMGSTNKDRPASHTEQNRLNLARIIMTSLTPSPFAPYNDTPSTIN